MTGKLSTGRKILRVVKWTVIGALAAPFLSLLLVIPLYVTDSRCGTPGDSGGCEMGFGMVVMASPLPGAAIGFLVGLWRALQAR